MNRSEQLDDLDRRHAPQSEITLGTATLLAIFFGLVLLCAVFFGFGYSLGRHSTQTSPTPSSDSSDSSAPQDDSPSSTAAKPSPGNPAGRAASLAAADSDTLRSTPVMSSTGVNSDSGGSPADPTLAKSSARTVRLNADPPAAASSRQLKSQGATQTDGSSRSATPATRLNASQASASAAASAPGNSPLANTPFMVQIAAVSHPEDADVLVRALKKHGHDVVTRQDPSDHLIHVQLGPFTSRKDAEAMRQTLLTEGYNAIVK